MFEDNQFPRKLKSLFVEIQKKIYIKMSTPEELTAQITELGEKIKVAKADKQPKELWDEHLQAMLKAKVRKLWMRNCAMNSSMTL